MTSAKVSNCQNWSELVQINVKKSPLKGDFFIKTILLPMPLQAL